MKKLDLPSLHQKSLHTYNNKIKMLAKVSKYHKQNAGYKHNSRTLSMRVILRKYTAQTKT